MDDDLKDNAICGLVLAVLTFALVMFGYVLYRCKVEQIRSIPVAQKIEVRK